MNNKEILLVEDNPSDEKLTIRGFRKCGVANEIVVAHDGAEALDYLWRRGQFANLSGEPLPTLVLLDLKLPKLDGLEVLREIRNHEATRLLRVVVLTGSKEEEDIVNSYSLGASAYVRKPVDFTEFAETAKTLGLFWLLLNEAPPQRTPGTT